MPPVTPAPTEVPDDEEISSNVDHPVMIINESDSNSEDENDYNGYELLSQDPNNCFEVEDNEEDSNFVGEEMLPVIGAHAPNQNSSRIPASHYDGQEELEGAKEPVKMDEEHIETIKSVMKGITLPSSSLPPWANFIPEEEWKAQLFSEMQLRKSNQGRKCHFFNATKNKEDLQAENFR